MYPLNKIGKIKSSFMKKKDNSTVEMIFYFISHVFFQDERGSGATDPSNPIYAAIRQVRAFHYVNSNEGSKI